MTETPSAAVLWFEISKAFTNRAFMRPSATWLSGLAGRTGPGRLQRLRSSAAAKELDALVAGLGSAQMSQLVAYSQVNLEQALSALRLTLVANISIPVGMLVLFNQFLPGSLQGVVTSLPTAAIGLPVSLALSILVLILWFAYAGVDAARDLNHLLRLKLADAGYSAGGTEEEAIDAIGPVTDLA